MKPVSSKKLNPIQVALKYYQAGDLRKAEKLCKLALRQHQDEDEILHLLGLIEYQTGQYNAAISTIGKAVRINPYSCFYFNNLGLALKVTGRIDEAIENFSTAVNLKPDFMEGHFNLGLAFQLKSKLEEAARHLNKALQLRPDIPELYNNLGNVYAKMGLLTEARNIYKKAIEIRRDYAEAYNNLGNVLSAEGKQKEAETNYRKAMAIQPDYAEAYNNLGNSLAARGRIQDALEHFKKALKLKPDYAEACFNKGNTLAEINMADAAIEAFTKAISLRQDYPEAYNNLGSIYSDKWDEKSAIENFLKALDLRPDFAEALNNLGNAYFQMGRLVEAAKKYEEALKANPDFAEAFNNLGNAYSEMGRMNKAIETYNKAIILKPDYADAHKNMGMTYLLTQNFKEGWKEYEWRLKANRIKLPSLFKPRWNGDPLNKKTIYVYAEQGMGDTIQFSRYLPLLHSMGGKVLFRPQNALVSLFKQNNLNSEIIDPDVLDDDFYFDTHIPLLSLPAICDTNLHNIPYPSGYLKADTQKIEMYKSRFFDNNQFKIGIFWQGNPGLKPDKNRSMSLSCFYPLAGLPNVRLYSLQKGYGIEQLNKCPEEIDIVNLGNSFNDFSDTAAAIENLDLLISIDTSVAHLSGAMGKKTWVILPSHHEWRWFLDMDCSPWYKNMRLFRHRERNNWSEIMKRILQLLQENISSLNPN